jgi:hypothetical protein
MKRQRLALIGMAAVLAVAPCWPAGGRSANLSVSCTVIGRIAMTYRASGEGVASLPAVVSSPVPDSQIVRYQVAPGAKEATLSATIRSITNLHSTSYRLMATLVSADAEDSWRIGGVPLVVGATVPVASIQPYNSDQTHQVRVLMKDPGKSSAAQIRLQVLPN